MGSAGNGPVRVAQVIGKVRSGGVESTLFNWYRHFNHDRYRFDFYIDADSEAPVPQECLDAGARVFRVPPYQSGPAYVQALRRYFLAEAYPVVHAHLSTLNALPLLAARQAGVPVRICHNHNTAHWREGKRAALKYLLRPTARALATHYFACGQYAGSWMFGSRAMANNRVAVVPSPVHIGRFTADEDQRRAMRERLGMQDRFVVGHVGRFVQQKNHRYLIDIFAEVKRLRPHAALLLLGNGELEAETRRYAAALGLAEAVHFAGQVGNPQDYYQAMDVFVLPSLFEGLPLVALEAQATATPCLFSDKVTPEVGVTEAAGFVPLKATAAEWADRIVACEGKKPVGGVVRQLRAAGFDIETVVEKVTSCYDTLLPGVGEG